MVYSIYVIYIRCGCGLGLVCIYIYIYIYIYIVEWGKKVAIYTYIHK